MLDTMRAFLAMNLELAALRRATDIAAEARALPLAPTAVWLPPTKYHVTLCFLGEVDVGLAPAISDLLRASIEGRESPRVMLGAPSGFPDISAARVVFLTIDDVDGATAALHDKLSTLLEELGLPREPRPFVPHLTLARSRQAADLGPWLASLPARAPVSAYATEVVLYRSDLARPGAEYVALERVGLAPPKSLKSTRPALRRAH